MVLKLISEHLLFEDGDIHALGLEAYVTSPSVSPTATLRSNTVEYPALDHPGDYLLTINNCTVKSQKSGVARRVHSFTMRATITAEAVARGVAEVPVHFHALLRICVVGHNNEPVSGRPIVGFVLDQLTIEVSVNEDGYLDLLVPPGEYMAYLLEEPSVNQLLLGPVRK
jgi:hypothetical protein